MAGAQSLWNNYIGEWLQSTHSAVGDWLYQTGADIGHTLHQAGSWLKHFLQPIGNSVGEWIQSAANALRIGGADDPIALGPKVTAKKIADAPLDYSIYRLSMFAPLIFAAILNWMNRGMIMQGVKRVARSIRLTPQMIQNNPEKIAEELQIDFSREEDFVNEIKKEVEELDTSIRPFVNSRTSEERLQGFANRLVWANNRLKAAVSHSEFLAASLSVELGMMKSLGDVFLSIIDFNDVSDGLRNQAVSLYNSLSAIEVKEPSATKTSTDRLLQFLDKLQHTATYKRSQGFNSLVTDIFRDVRHKNPQELKEHLAQLQSMVTAKKDQHQLVSLGNAAVRLLTQAQRQTTASRFVYLPEIKLSFFASLLRNLKIGQDPMQGVFWGMDVQDYEQAKLLQRELENMLQEAQNGEIVNGMFDQFENFYQRAINCLRAYVRNNARNTPQIDTRVHNMKADLDKLYVQYMGKQPTAVIFEKEIPAQTSSDEGMLPEVMAPAQ